MNEEQSLKALSLAVHELRTPLTVVAGYLRMVLNEHGGALSDSQRRMLSEAERSCGRATALVAELNDFARLEAGVLALARQPVNLADVATEIAGGLTEGLDRDVHLELRGIDPTVMVMGDHGRLGDVVRALMQGVLRARGEPGVIAATVSTLRDTTPHWAVVAVGHPTALDGLVESARGTPPAFDEWRGGLGMALPVGRRVIEALGGSLWSEPGGAPQAGSAFRLPLRS